MARYSTPCSLPVPVRTGDTLTYELPTETDALTLSSMCHNITANNIVDGFDEHGFTIVRIARRCEWLAPYSHSCIVSGKDVVLNLSTFDSEKIDQLNAWIYLQLIKLDGRRQQSEERLNGWMKGRPDRRLCGSSA